MFLRHSGKYVMWVSISFHWRQMKYLVLRWKSPLSLHTLLTIKLQTTRDPMGMEIRCYAMVGFTTLHCTTLQQVKSARMGCCCQFMWRFVWEKRTWRRWKLSKNFLLPKGYPLLLTLISNFELVVCSPKWSGKLIIFSKFELLPRSFGT